MRSWLREPLLHFALAGAALFAVDAALRNDAPEAAAETRERIVVTQERLVQLATGFARARQRAPTRAELDALVADYVREEVLYRRALELGLVEDDVVVRRRLRQKVEFLLDAEGEAQVPREAELAAHLAAHPDRFRLPAQLAFQQRYFSGESGRAAAEHLLARLARGAAIDTESTGDATLLPEQVPLVPSTVVAGQFGKSFAAAVAELPPGHWSGPVQSDFGWHVVRVDERVPGGVPALDEARDRVLSDLVDTRRRASVERAYADLASRYEIVVPQADAREAGAAPAAPAAM